ncbi:MAG: HAMP domain-containing histidine kinase, partial [Clostridiales bacterium]|nr:HAMP domain-containing histidine kinase [Clostridiales bacterium]
MKQPTKNKRFITRYFDPALDLRIQAFNLLAFAGMASGVITALSALLSNAGLYNIALNLSGSLIGVLCLIFARRTGNYHAGFVIATTLTFLILFPLLFFTAGGYRSGMPCFFVFAILFTAIMLENKRERAAAIILEFTLYAACFFIAYFAPGTVRHFETELDYMIDALVGVVVVGLILIIVVLLYIRIYDSRQQQLGSLDRLKMEFFQNVNHEMKTQLMVIISYINNADDMLAYDGDVDKDALRECFGRAQAEIKSLARMTEYSLALAAAQEGKRNMEPLDFAALLRSGADSFRALLKKDGNSLTLQIPDRLPKITGNRDMLGQLVSNLLYNAGKHTKNGEIIISLTQEGNRFITTVADTGKGIDPAMLPRIFERG